MLPQNGSSLLVIRPESPIFFISGIRSFAMQQATTPIGETAGWHHAPNSFDPAQAEQRGMDLEIRVSRRVLSQTSDPMRIGFGDGAPPREGGGRNFNCPTNEGRSF